MDKPIPLDNPASGIMGKRVGAEPADEREHFIKCARCGQMMDCRDLGQVFHHEDPDHKPIPIH
jgi:hypothetical protein